VDVKPNGIVSIFKKPEEETIEYSEEDWSIDPYDPEFYTKLIGDYKPQKIFIYKHLGWVGNSILMKLEKDRYLFVGETIYQFRTDDEILHYNSPIGNSDVPYPFAVGKKYVYFMLDMEYIPIDIYTKFVPEGTTDAYGYYYGHDGPEALAKYSNPMEELTYVHRRLW